MADTVRGEGSAREWARHMVIGIVGFFVLFTLVIVVGAFVPAFPYTGAAMAATQLGPAIGEERGADWRAFDVVAGMNNPLEKAIDQRWLYWDPSLGSELQRQWVDAIGASQRRRARHSPTAHSCRKE